MQYTIEDSTLSGIANAIRSKTGEATEIPVTSMAAKIQGITTGGSAPVLQEKEASVSQEEQVITPDTGYDGLSVVIVGAATLQNVTVSPSHEEQTIVPGDGYYGLSKVTIAAVVTDSALNVEGVLF